MSPEPCEVSYHFSQLLSEFENSSIPESQCTELPFGLFCQLSIGLRGGASEFSGEMIGWVLSGFLAGSQKVNIFQKADENNFQKNWRKKKQKEEPTMVLYSMVGLGAEDHY